jgi:cell wall-associated NlpC family hydrolase
MRRSTLAISAVFVTAVFASFVLLLAGAGASSQARAAESQDATAPQEGTLTGDTSVSQGSLPGVNAPPGVIAAMESPDYSQVVDNTSSERFDAPGWQTEASLQGYYGADYSVNASGITGSARFKVNIPANDYYSVYAWWPAGEANSTAARIGVSTTSGIKWVRVNQQNSGGDWVKIGDFQMEAGEDYVVRISSANGGSGAVIADAVAVIRGAFSPPPYDEQASGGEEMFSTASRASPRDIVRRARHFIGTRYKWGTCTKWRMSCTCLTKRTFKKFGHRLPMTERGQWRYDPSRRIFKRSHLRRGDIVFFKENGRRNGITHVGIFAGRGYLVHASGYFNKVVESKMRYIDGYFGAKRLRPR